MTATMRTPATSGRIAVVVNPIAGRGRGRQAARLAIARLEERGCEPRVYSGRSPEQTTALAAQALRDGADAFVVVGGDGTLSQVLDAVASRGIPLALVPAGTGNDLARVFGLPRDDPAAAVDVLFDGERTLVDVGLARGRDWRRHFLTVVAMGLDAKISDRTNRLSWPNGKARYYLAMAVELGLLAPTPFLLRADGGVVIDGPGVLLAVGNTSSYGGGIPICPEANPADGLLDITLVRAIGRARLLRFFPHLLAGHHLFRREVHHFRSSTVRIDTPGLTVCADGESLGPGPATISLLPAALTLCIPRNPEFSTARLTRKSYPQPNHHPKLSTDLA